MKVPLHFGEGVIELEIPKENLAGFFQPKKRSPDAIDADVLASAVKRCADLVQRDVRGERT